MDHKIYKKVVLVILDGFGIAHAGNGNAISLANIPTFDGLVANYPSLSLQASGPLVGLPWGEMGNSEVGHLNIGAGRIVGQDLPRITTAIQTGEFFKNKVFLEAVEHTKQNNSKLHLMGMISSGGVHSLDEHLYALLNIALENGQKNVFIHMFTDGRDTEPKAALEAVKKLRERMERIGVGSIASIAGRFYAMDRGGHWAQTELTFQALVNGRGETAHSVEECIETNYKNQIFDETIKPTVIVDAQNKPIAAIAENDAVIFFNFRSDRALQLTQDFVDPAVVPEEFRHQPLPNLYFATITEFLPGLPVHVAFETMDLKNNLAEVLSHSNLAQFHIAESEKYAHVTVFFNCGRSEKFPGEERVIIASPSNAHNYSDQPEMSANEVTTKLVNEITNGQYSFYLANFANGDMVGHTGNLSAGIKAVEFLDACVKRIIDACLATDAILLITADHGNIEQMINPKTGDINKDHTTSPVPFLVAAQDLKFKKPKSISYISLAAEVPGGVISDIAPTILDLFGLPKPPDMTGVNLFQEFDLENGEGELN
jgi:2,3-bisphosphoglycerate-independent phosphoglycerate mutase